MLIRVCVLIICRNILFNKFEFFYVFFVYDVMNCVGVKIGFRFVGEKLIFKIV